MQEGRPIAYASKSLNETQQRYAVIEKELLAVVFACKKFDFYIYGKSKFKVESDHKPLETLYTRPINEITTRLQRMMMSLQRYDLDIQYKPGKEMYIVDTLSRAYNILNRIIYSSDRKYIVEINNKENIINKKHIKTYNIKEEHEDNETEQEKIEEETEIKENVNIEETEIIEKKEEKIEEETEIKENEKIEEENNRPKRKRWLPEKLGGGLVK